MAKVLIGNFKGPKGDKGDKGDPGTAASIQVGTTQTVQPEENAEVTNTGTTSAAVLNFKIPRGEDGMTDLTAEYSDASEYTCQPTVNAPAVVKGVDGKTEQVEITGSQLFDAENTIWNANASSVEYKKTETGVNFTTIINLGYAGIYAQFEALNSAKTYTISMDITVSDKNFSTFMLGISGDSNNTLYINASDFTENVPYHVDLQLAEVQNRSFVIYINNNGYSVGTTVTVENIMLSESQDESPWEPYTGGSPAPSPDYPQVIKGVGGMGHFDGEWAQGNISSTGTVGTETTGITSANAIPCKQNDNIAVTYEDSIDVIAVAFYNASGAYISTSTSGNSVDTFTATAPANAAGFKVNLRVVSGSTITPNGAKYCTVTINGEYQTGVEVNGKNWFNINGNVNTQGNDYQQLNVNTVSGNVLTCNVNGQRTNAVGQTISGLNSKTVTFSAKVISFGSGIEALIFVYENGGYNNNLACAEEVNSVIKITCAISTDNPVFAFATRNGTGAQFTDIQVEIGETNTDYTPYHHTTLSIPLTSPLYEGDKICYVKPGESYVDAEGDTVIADRILYGVYRENAVVVFDGSEDETWLYYSNSDDPNINQFTALVSGSYYDIATPNVMCDKMLSRIAADRSNETNICYSDTAGGRISFNISRDIVDGNNISQWKTWLQSNPLTVLYKLAQPYFKPFADQSIFYGLRTDDTLSYVYSSDPIEPVLTVEVAKNSTGGYLLESYAQAQKNAISEANSQSRLSAIEQQLVNQATTPTK